MRRQACSLGLVVLWMGIGLMGLQSSVAAQDDGLSTTQLQLVDRYLDGLEKQSGYLAYVQIEEGFQNQFLVFSSTGMLEFKESSMSREEMLTVIQAESPEIRSEMSVTISQDQDYTIEADVRVVDGVLYVNAHYADQGANLPPLPEGWIVFDDTTEWEGLAPLQLNSYVASRVSPLRDRELLLNGLTDVVLENGELEDGTSADVIVMAFTKETIAGLLTPSETAMESGILGSVLDNMLDESMAMVRVYLNEDGDIVQMDTQIRLLSEVDLDQIEDIPFPEGTTLTFDATFDNRTLYSQINDTTLMPMGPPELSDMAYD